MSLNKLTPAGPNDEFSTWSWLKKLQTFLTGGYYPNVSSTANLTLGLNYFYPIDATSGNLVVTLPVAAKQLGKKYVIKKTDSSTHTVTVTADSTLPDYIDGATTFVLSVQNDTLVIESDGVSEWWILGAGAVIDNADMAPMPAVTFKGNNLGAAGPPLDLTQAQATAILNNFAASGVGHLKGLVPDPGASGGTTHYLREDATWAVPAGGGSVTIDTAAPGTPSAGDLWWKSDEGQLKIYFTDVDSSQWVDAMNLNTGAGTGISGGGMTRIAQVVCTGSQATVSFSSIPATYTNLLVVYSGQDTKTSVTDVQFRLEINGDTTAANYTSEQFQDGTSTTSAAGRVASTTSGVGIGSIPGTNTSGTNAVGGGDILIPNYAKTTFHKPVIGRSFVTSTSTPVITVYSGVGFVWMSTAAINALLLTAGGTAFVDGTTFTLYGLA